MSQSLNIPKDPLGLPGAQNQESALHTVRCGHKIKIITNQLKITHAGVFHTGTPTLTFKTIIKLEEFAVFRLPLPEHQVVGDVSVGV